MVPFTLAFMKNTLECYVVHWQLSGSFPYVISFDNFKTLKNVLIFSVHFVNFVCTYNILNNIYTFNF